MSTRADIDKEVALRLGGSTPSHPFGLNVQLDHGRQMTAPSMTSKTSTNQKRFSDALCARFCA